MVKVVVARLQDPGAVAEELSANKDAIKTSLLLSVINDASIMAHENGDALRIEDVVVSTQASDDLASATGDPHLKSVTGQKFDVNMPGSYALIRAPQDRRLPAKLELNATLRPSVGSPCGLYIKSIELGGEWLGNQVLSVVPLQRNVDGQNGAGNSTLRPFSVRLHGGEYEQRGDLGKEGHGLSGRVRIVPLWRQLYADAGRPLEAQAFQFHIRGAGAEYGAVLEAAQAAHQALDVQAAGLRSLGFEHLGGLIGTEEHDGSLEQFSDECKAFRSKSRQSRPVSLAGSSMAASWDASI